MTQARFISSFLLLALIGCGDSSVNDAGADAPTDAGQDATGADASDDGVDAFDAGDLSPPECAPLPAFAPPACGTARVRDALLPGVGAPGFDAALADKALAFDRGFHAIAALYTGVNTEVGVAAAEDRETIRRFLQEDTGWDLAAFAGKPVEDMVSWRKVAGAYSGAGATADAFRYAVLRDEGAACEDVDRARTQLRASADALHRAIAITGAPGVVARGYQRNDLPTIGHETTPLFDADGNPLPEEKTNGTWRDDQSGELSNYDWEDSCSRDMLIGWVFGMASVWEVIALDPAFEAERARLVADARAIAEQLMAVGESGYDLEIPDADGRVTYHGYLNEAAIDRSYVPGFTGNGQHATMALGIMAALAAISDDAAVRSYVHNELIRRRGLHEIVRESAGIIDFGAMTNFSNYNMTFTGAWLASRYLCDEDARQAVNEGITVDLYGVEGDARHPIEQGQSFFDVVYLAALSGASAFAAGDRAQVDDSLDRATSTLRAFPEAPYWDVPVENCEPDEIAALRCIAIDGETVIDLLAERGRGDAVVATAVLPMNLRPTSNYHWRSDPFRVNGDGSGQSLLPAVDFRVAYWMARYTAIR